MKKQFHAKLFACISLSFCIFQAYATRQHQECQDVIVNNVIVQTGLSDSQRLYNAIKPILDQYKRPITVLDLGAGQGYFAFRIAHDYDSTCIMVEDNGDSFRQADQLLKLCHLNSNLHNIGLLNKRMSLQELQKLADCEHFDVILAFDYINPDDRNWKQRVNAILRLGDNIFIQTPWSSISEENMAKRSVVEFLANQSGKLILQTPCVYEPKIEEQMFWFERHKEGLRCRCFYNESKDSYIDLFRIKSSYTQKTFLKKGHSSGPEWKKGINLITFLMLSGTYPPKNVIKKAVAKLTQEKLTDFVPKNLIVQGNNIALIDQNDKEWREGNVQKSLGYINDIIDQSSASDVLNLLKQDHKRHIRKHTRNWLSRLIWKDHLE
ncbi:MAG: hypothetical protein V1646_04520 [bacterium]